jgi:phage gp45-like
MDGNSITNLQNIDTNNQPLNILSGSAFPQLNLTGGINCNNTAFFYQCPSVYAGTGNLVLGSDTLGTEIQTGPFGSRQTEMSILPNLINVNSAFTNFLGNDITMAQGRIQDLKRVDGGGAGSNFIEMVDAGFLNAINISSNAGAIMQETTSTNNIGILSTGGGMAVAVGDLQIRNADPAGSLNIVKQFGGNINLDSAGLVVVNNSDLDMNNNNIINVSGINGFTPVGGIYAGTSDGTLINNTTEQSVLPGSGVGSLTIPANTFQVGDSFHCVVAGDCSLENKDEIQIKLKENGNILAQTPVFEVEDANVGGNAFEIEIDFTIRSIGATGSIATNFDFSYNKDGTDSKDFRGTRAMDVQPIDTTVASTLEITVQFPTNVASSLQTRLFRLQKVY